jgi:hypothetical protein
MPPIEIGVGLDPLNHLTSPSCSSSIATAVAFKNKEIIDNNLY